MVYSDTRCNYEIRVKYHTSVCTATATTVLIIGVLIFVHVGVGISLMNAMRDLILW